MSPQDNLRTLIFLNHGGMSPIKPTSNKLKEKSKLPFYSHCFLRIKLPIDEQMSKNHPLLVRRLICDWNRSLSRLQCNTGNFGRALREGRVSLGHIWAELYCLCMDEVTVRLGFGHIWFDEYCDFQEDKDQYEIQFFFSESFPDELGGLEYLVSGYLNAAIEGRKFNIHQRLANFVRYRANPIALSGKKTVTSYKKKCTNHLI